MINQGFLHCVYSVLGSEGAGMQLRYTEIVQAGTFQAAGEGPMYHIEVSNELTEGSGSQK